MFFLGFSQVRMSQIFRMTKHAAHFAGGAKNGAWKSQPRSRLVGIGTLSGVGRAARTAFEWRKTEPARRDTSRFPAKKRCDRDLALFLDEKDVRLARAGVFRTNPHPAQPRPPGSVGSRSVNASRTVLHLTFAGPQSTQKVTTVTIVTVVSVRTRARIRAYACVPPSRLEIIYVIDGRTIVTIVTIVSNVLFFNVQTVDSERFADPRRKSVSRGKAVTMVTMVTVTMSGRQRFCIRELGGTNSLDKRRTIDYYYRVSASRARERREAGLAKGYLEKLLELASARALNRIAEDRDRASQKVKPLLEHIEKNLFEKRLTATTLMEDCGVRDRAMSVTFRQELNMAPADYIRDRRMETAARLLRDTNLTVATIGELVYDCDLGAFSHRFSRWAKMSPKKYRKAIRADPDSVRFPGRRASASQSLTVDGRKLDRGLALAHWEELRHLPAKKQREMVREPYSLTTPALFDVLREKSREEGRKDRQVGVRLAEVALASLDGVAGFMTAEELANRKAQGMAWLGNALRLALDFPEAERAFAEAWKLLAEDPDLEVVAELCHIEGELFQFQSKYEAALKLEDRAVEIFRSLGKIRSLAESLLSRGVTIGYSRGFESAIPDFLEALGLAESVNDSYLTACAHQDLVTAYALSGRTEEALKSLAVARVCCADAGDCVLANQLDWVEGFVAKQENRPELAEDRFLAARSGFIAAGESGFAAVVALDLAALCLEQGRVSEALAYASGAIPVLESFEKHPEAVEALALLGGVAADRELSLEIVQKMRNHLAHLHSFARTR